MNHVKHTIAYPCSLLSLPVPFVFVPSPALCAGRRLSGPAARTPTGPDCPCLSECGVAPSKCCIAPKCCRDARPVYDLSAEIPPTAEPTGALHVPVAPGRHPWEPQGGEWAEENNDNTCNYVKLQSSWKFNNNPFRKCLIAVVSVDLTGVCDAGDAGVCTIGVFGVETETDAGTPETGRHSVRLMVGR